MALYDTVRDLPARRRALRPSRATEYVVGPTFTRKTTVIRLDGSRRGRARGGRHLRRRGTGRPAGARRRCSRWPASGRSTRCSRRLESLPLFEQPPEREVYVDYRRWAFESAALDLALRQAGRSLGGPVGREPRPVTFVASGGARRPALDRAAPLAPRSLPRPAVQARRPGRTGRTRSSASCERSDASTRSTSRGSTPAPSSTTRPTPTSTGA